RGSAFARKFWGELCRNLGVSRRLSTAFHPQTDGQTERQNQSMEQYLRAYVNYQQDDWVDFLPLAEFAYNNSVNATTGMTPFFANYGMHPKFAVASIGKPSKDSSSIAADLLRRQMEQIEEHLKDQIMKASAYQAHYYDDKHSQVSFSAGDQVYLRTDNIKTKRPCKKLDHTKIGPYTILERIGLQAYRLDLPANIRIHKDFHVSYLEPYRKNEITGRLLEPPPPVEVEGDFEHEVESILDSRVLRKTLQYRVKWKGYNNPDDDTWEPLENVVHASDLVAEFHYKYPDKPRPS